MAEHSWKDYSKKPLSEPDRLRECSVWLLAGEEGWLRREFQERLLGALLSEEERTLGLEVFDLTPGLLRTQPPEGSWARRIVGAANTLPFLSPRRVVVVGEAHLLPAAEQQEIVSALKTLPETTILILSSSETAGKKRSRLSSKLSTAVKKAGNVVRFDALKPGEAIAWAQEEARKSGKRLESSAATFLVSKRLGTDLGSLKQEIDKLVLFVGSLPAIKVAHIEEMTPRLLEDRVFELTDALSSGKSGQALAFTLLRRFVSSKEDAIWVLATIASHFRLLWQTKWLLERGWRPGQPVKDFDEEGRVLLEGKDSVEAVFARPKISWKIPRFAEQARRFTWPQLEQAFRSLAQCDLALKGLSSPPRNDPGLALELALISLFPASKGPSVRRREEVKRTA
ncbi:MAG: DNA polymerase III subunit delta [Armatimonadetes bacterium]|nr:DNA polymerase III subunit delta [Armatimonadota bacterium]NIM24013.1 DNA polymerase III subunit delta [Armatimonadota bacterium]NIM67863.1 DNA polymerase III subunit delta [Armatimonadota bacterium]NIM76394.1 DNA polymerase III subunit delta [Armatimonadota bacterium]NIN06093.1 DNA polymerase III subunit delta [Armatimonadota bacterium]